MSLRSGAIAGGVVLLVLAACSRSPPLQAPARQAADAGGEDVVLAGGPTQTPVQDPAAPPSDTADAAPFPELAGAPVAAPPPLADPLEPVNRGLYAVDAAVGHAIRKRPQIVRLDHPPSGAVVHAAHNALDNLDEPGTAANDLLQRKLASAGRAAVRFVVNSTVGVVGLFDVASRLGLEKHTNNLDQTLASYGAPAGPYIYLPIAGPTTLRATMAMAAESYIYPPHWLHLAAGIGAAVRGASYAKLAARAVGRADGAGDAAVGKDSYARTRSAYYASRAGHAPATLPAGPERPTALASLGVEK